MHAQGCRRGRLICRAATAGNASRRIEVAASSAALARAVVADLAVDVQQVASAEHVRFEQERMQIASRVLGQMLAAADALPAARDLSGWSWWA